MSCGSGKPEDDSDDTERHVGSISGKILTAFNYACEVGDFDIARRLLAAFERSIEAFKERPDAFRNYALQDLDEAHARLSALGRLGRPTRREP